MEHHTLQATMSAKQLAAELAGQQPDREQPSSAHLLESTVAPVPGMYQGDPGNTTMPWQYGNEYNPTPYNPGPYNPAPYTPYNPYGPSTNPYVPISPGQGSSPWVMPGGETPPTPSVPFQYPNSHLPPVFGSGLPPTFVPILPNPTTPGKEAIPTLVTGQNANQYDETLYPNNSPLATLTNQNKASIVEIYGPAKGNNQEEYLGSGFFVDSHGDIATALHVVKDDSSVDVITSDGQTHKANVVSTRPTADLAIISIGSQEQTQPVVLAPNSETLSTGQTDAALGHPEGWPKLYLSPGQYTHPVTSSDVAVTGLSGVNPEQNLLESNMNVQAGDSGGPVFNSKGQVVGVIDRGDGGSTSDSVSVNDLWPMLTTSMKQDQPNHPQLPSAFPSSIHFGTGTVISGLDAAGLALSLKGGSFLRLGGIARGVGVGLGVTRLFSSDFGFLSSSLSHGSGLEKLDAGIDVGSDLMLVGGGIASFIPDPAVRTAATAVQLVGGLLRVGNDLGAFRRYS